MPIIVVICLLVISVFQSFVFGQSLPADLQASLPIINAENAAKDWLKANLRDPASLEIIETKPISGNEQAMLIGVEYRAKNGFGGMNVETKLFVVKEGKVVEVNDFNPEAAVEAVQALSKSDPVALPDTKQPSEPINRPLSDPTPATAATPIAPELSEHEKYKNGVAGAPISLVSIDFSLAGAPYGPPLTPGTIYSLEFMSITEKVPDGYLMRAWSPDGKTHSADTIFLRTKTDYPESAVFTDPDEYALCVGPHDSPMMFASVRQPFEFRPLSEEGDKWVVERLHPSKQAAKH